MINDIRRRVYIQIYLKLFVLNRFLIKLENVQRLSKPHFLVEGSRVGPSGSRNGKEPTGS